jgi:hypothetical protein
MGELFFFVTYGSYLIIPFVFDAPETESIYMIRDAHFVYSFISMKRTTVKRITPVVEAIAVSLKKCFLCAYRIDQKDNINECVVQIKAFGCCLFNLWEFHSGFSRKTANVTV